MIHTDVNFAQFWTNSKSCHEIRTSFLITKLLTDIPNDFDIKLCNICNQQFSDLYVHVCCSCNCTFKLRDLLWDVITENFTLDLFVELYSYDEEHLYQTLLGRKLRTHIENDDQNELLKLFHTHVVQCLAEFNRVSRGLISNI